MCLRSNDSKIVKYVQFYQPIFSPRDVTLLHSNIKEYLSLLKYAHIVIDGVVELGGAQY
jgi:hypothetical protein